MIRSVSHDARYQTDFSNGSRSAAADVPVEKGGGGQGFGPHELLEAALGTCLCMTVRMYAEQNGMLLTAVRSDVRIDRSVPGAPTLNYSLEFDGELLTEQRERLTAAAENCPVARTLTGKLAVRRTTP